MAGAQITLCGHVVLCLLLTAPSTAGPRCGYISPGQCRELVITCRAVQLQYGYASHTLPPACQRAAACCSNFHSLITALTTPTFRSPLAIAAPPLPRTVQQPNFGGNPFLSATRSLSAPSNNAQQAFQQQPAASSIRPNHLPVSQQVIKPPPQQVIKPPPKLIESPPRQQLSLTNDASAVIAELAAECGRPSSKVKPRKTKGGEQDADPARWPWMVLLGERDSRDDDDPEWTCGAVLVTRAHVLTAAHCVLGLPAHRLVLRLGEYDLSTRDDGEEQDVGVRTITVHPEFRKRHHDVAVLELARPVPPTDRVRPICLPPPAPQPHRRSGDIQPLWVAGWGRESFLGDNPDVLQEAYLHVVPDNQCELTYRQLPDFERSFPGGFNGTKVCAADPLETGADACMGDSGGPLVTMEDGRYQLVGLVSVGVGCGDPQFPGVYTRIGSYVNWVMNIIS